MKPSTDPVVVTDHAVLRYLERAMGLNVEMVREHILAVCLQGAAYGAVCVRSEGVRFEIANGRIVTVTPDNKNNMPNRTARAIAQRKIEQQRSTA